MSKFKVGQMVEVLDSNPYNITIAKSRGIITEIHPGGEVAVKMTYYPNNLHRKYLGEMFDLEGQYLKILTSTGSEDISPVCLKIREMEERRKTVINPN